MAVLGSAIRCRASAKEAYLGEHGDWCGVERYRVRREGDRGSEVSNSLDGNHNSNPAQAERCQACWTLLRDHSGKTGASCTRLRPPTADLLPEIFIIHRFSVNQCIQSRQFVSVS